jgi:arginine-tRNA-protein transferase
MHLLHRFLTEPEPCAYLPEQTSRLLYEVVSELSPEEYEARMNSGWRKFGMYLFRPVCESCRECRPIRILADEFSPDRSQRRCLERNADLTVRFARPVVDDARVDLYNRYHAGQNAFKGWDEIVKTAESYAESFLYNPLRTGVEVSVWENDILRAVALTEVTPNVVSGIYHYHDPDEAIRRRSLGTFVMLQTIELARKLGKPYAYFGYYVAGCGSLNYKARFQPCEIRNEAGEWVPFVAL